MKVCISLGEMEVGKQGKPGRAVQNVSLVLSSGQHPLRKAPLTQEWMQSNGNITTIWPSSIGY